MEAHYIVLTYVYMYTITNITFITLVRLLKVCSIHVFYKKCMTMTLFAEHGGGLEIKLGHCNVKWLVYDSKL